MVEVIPLTGGARPPRGERCFVVEWSDKATSSFMKAENGLHYTIGRPKHRFWSTEAILLARRLGFSKIYYIGRPEEVGWPAVMRQNVGEKSRRSRSSRRPRPQADARV